MATCNGAQYCGYYQNAIKIVLIQYIVFGIITQTYANKSLSLGDGKKFTHFFHRNFYLSCYCYPGGHPVKCVRRVHGLLRLWQNYDKKVSRCTTHKLKLLILINVIKNNVLVTSQNYCLQYNALICRVLLYKDYQYKKVLMVFGVVYSNIVAVLATPPTPSREHIVGKWT